MCFSRASHWRSALCFITRVPISYLTTSLSLCLLWSAALYTARFVFPAHTQTQPQLMEFIICVFTRANRGRRVLFSPTTSSLPPRIPRTYSVCVCGSISVDTTQKELIKSRFFLLSNNIATETNNVIGAKTKQTTSKIRMCPLTHTRIKIISLRNQFDQINTQKGLFYSERRERRDDKLKLV